MKPGDTGRWGTSPRCVYIQASGSCCFYSSQFPPWEAPFLFHSGACPRAPCSPAQTLPRCDMQRLCGFWSSRWARVGTERVCGRPPGKDGGSARPGVHSASAGSPRTHGGLSRKKTKAEGEEGTGSPSCGQRKAGARPHSHEAPGPEEGFSRAPSPATHQLTGPEHCAPPRPPPLPWESVKGVIAPALPRGAGRARGEQPANGAGSWDSGPEPPLPLLTLSASLGRSKPFHKVSSSPCLRASPAQVPPDQGQPLLLPASPGTSVSVYPPSFSADPSSGSFPPARKCLLYHKSRTHRSSRTSKKTCSLNTQAAAQINAGSSCRPERQEARSSPMSPNKRLVNTQRSRSCTASDAGIPFLGSNGTHTAAPEARPAERQLL